MEPLFGLSVFYVLLDVLVLWNGKVLALCFGYICFVVVVVVLFVCFFFLHFYAMFQILQKTKTVFCFHLIYPSSPRCNFPSVIT